MIKKSIFIFIFTIIVFRCFAQVFDPEFTEKIAKAEQQNFKLKSGFKESNNYALYDLVYQRMEWKVDPAIKYIAGSVTSYFKSEVEVLHEIVFDLNSLMTVDSV